MADEAFERLHTERKRSAASEPASFGAAGAGATMQAEMVFAMRELTEELRRNREGSVRRETGAEQRTQTPHWEPRAQDRTRERTEAVTKAAFEHVTSAIPKSNEQSGEGQWVQTLALTALRFAISSGS